jgi:hypothetical protein
MQKRRKYRGAMLALALAATVAGCASMPMNRVGIVFVSVSGPPPRRAEVVHARPGPEYVWIEGNWAWSGGGYVWMAGHYDRRPQGSRGWEQGRWKRHGRDGWYWSPGRWR